MILSNRSLNHKILANNRLPSAPFGLSWASLSDNILSWSEWLSESIWLLIWFVNNIYYHHCSILLSTIVSTTSLSCVSVSPVQSYLSLLPYLISILNPSPMSTGPGWRKKQSFIRWTNWTLNPSSPAGSKTTLDQSIIMIFWCSIFKGNFTCKPTENCSFKNIFLLLQHCKIILSHVDFLPTIPLFSRWKIKSVKKSLSAEHKI